MKPGLGLVVLTAMIVFVCALASAATPLPPAPSFGWCYDGSNATGFYGVRSCPAPPPPAAGRITASNIAYVPSSGVRFTGVTEWAAIWGHATATDVEVPFPGRSNSSPSIVNFTRGGYLAAHFKPSGAGARFGYITHTEYNYGGDLTWSISTAAGDFNPANPKCRGATTSGQTIGRWTTAPTSYASFCPVAQGVDYYLNVKLTNPAQGTTTCGANLAQCVIGTANAFGG